MDSPVMVALSKAADLMILNFVAFIACIPIFTIGASLTALHYVSLKMVRKEDGYIVRSFFKSFKENFKQATICWLVILVFIVVFVLDLFIINNSGMEHADVFRIALLAVGILAMMVIVYIFPLLARFENTIKGTLKNALFMSILGLPKTILMMVACGLPVILYMISLNLIPIIFLFGISGPAYLCALLYSGTFKKFEPQTTDGDVGDDWHVEDEPTENE
jgi:uncharacterized membrane protein YesL